MDFRAAAAALFLAFISLVSCADNATREVCPTTVFAFADSLSDTGNLCTAAPNLCAANALPYGQDFPGLNQPTGRFSNGLNILDCIVQGLGLPGLLDPILLTAGGNFTYGINFANAGCTASVLGSIFLPSFARNNFDLLTQVGEFSRIQNIVKGAYPDTNVDFSRLPSADSFSDALYYVELGGNDINYGNLFARYNESTVQGIVPAVMGAITAGINDLVNMGARNFMIFGLPAQGCATINLALGKSMNDSADQYDEMGCYKVYNRISVYYNSKLKEVISDLRENHTDANFMYADYYNVHLAILNGTVGSFQNLSNLLNACCGERNHEYNCPSPPLPFVGCLCTMENTCHDADNYAIFDGIHFTEAFNKAAAAAFLMEDSPYLDTAGVKLRTNCSSHN